MKLCVSSAALADDVHTIAPQNLPALLAHTLVHTNTEVPPPSVQLPISQVF